MSGSAKRGGVLPDPPRLGSCGERSVRQRDTASAPGVSTTPSTPAESTAASGRRLGRVRGPRLPQGVRHAPGLLALTALATPAGWLSRVAARRSNSCTPLAEPACLPESSHSPRSPIAPRPHRIIFFSSIRVLVMSYMPHLLLDYTPPPLWGRVKAHGRCDRRQSMCIALPNGGIIDPLAVLHGPPARRSRSSSHLLRTPNDELVALYWTRGEGGSTSAGWRPLCGATNLPPRTGVPRELRAMEPTAPGPELRRRLRRTGRRDPLDAIARSAGSSSGWLSTPGGEWAEPPLR